MHEVPTYPPTAFRPLTINGGGFEEFAELFGRLRKRWIKVEFVQSYDETGSEAYSAHLKGEHQLAATLVRNDVKGQWVYDHARQHGVQMIRIRIYRAPLTDYLAHFEYHAYLADEEMGEAIYTVEWDKAAKSLLGAHVSDFLVFDDWAAVALLYDESSGTVEEARLVEDPREVQSYISLSESLLKLAEPLRSGRFAALAERSRL